jgi:hypothetical protein
MDEAKVCPKCGLVNPSTALQCDCGYNFIAQRIKRSTGTPEPSAEVELFFATTKTPKLREVSKLFKLLKLAVPGGAIAGLGITEIITGEKQGIIAGFGALVAALMIFGMMGYILFRKNQVEVTVEKKLTSGSRNVGLLWLGILFTLLSGLLYLWLHFSMSYVENRADVVVPSILLLIPGLGFIGLGLRREAHQ